MRHTCRVVRYQKKAGATNVGIQYCSVLLSLQRDHCGSASIGHHSPNRNHSIGSPLCPDLTATHLPCAIINDHCTSTRLLSTQLEKDPQTGHRTTAAISLFCHSIKDLPEGIITASLVRLHTYVSGTTTPGLPLYHDSRRRLVEQTQSPETFHRRELLERRVIVSEKKIELVVFFVFLYLTDPAWSQVDPI
jgi:hypothetical protein